MKLTEWFDGYVLPTVAGVYEVDDGLPDGPVWAWWDGYKFGFRSWISPQNADDYQLATTCLPRHSKWRGLAEKP